MPNFPRWCKLHSVLYLPKKDFDYKCPACFMWKVADDMWNSAMEIGMREAAREHEDAEY